MCGIVGYVGNQEAAPILLDGLSRLEYRGYDSAGVAVHDGEAIHMLKASGRLQALRERVDAEGPLQGTCGIGHTRWATHGAPTQDNAHPHLSNDGKFAVVHNGIIENYLEQREELKARGFVFLSETDTEVIVHLMDMYYQGDLKQAFMQTAARLDGSYALGILCADAPGQLLVMKNASPLILGLGAGENLFASDVTALLPHTHNIIDLDDGEIALITSNDITVMDSLGNVLQKEVTRVTWNREAAERGGYEHFMLKEIMEQPKAVKSSIEPRIRDGRIVLDELGELARVLPQMERVVITACGSAYHAGVVAGYVMEDLCRIPVHVEVASELRYRNPLMDERTLVVVISQSGETADTIAALRECKRQGARTLAIVNVVGSTVAKLADGVLYTWAGPEISVATTKGYTTQLAVLSLLAIQLAWQRGTIDDARYQHLVGELQQLPSKCQRAIDLNTHAARIAKRYHGKRSLFYIGRNVDYAVCLEASLKLKEISYIHSEAYAAGELKHGTIALIDQNQLVIALACYQRLFEKLLSNVREVKARGARVLGVVREAERRIYSEADEALLVPDVDAMLVPVVEIIPLQLFAYHVAKCNGCDIDKPKNLAKSVTVE
ncbi:MAG: glutamine--fructose-6-phosphate transaminase (isomerizing) [Coriobacteriales bacterium]|nr:glutamine--fructose-6-phosphate transaminase (isomerizing) [Coriobacteriales bacterium]